MPANAGRSGKRGCKASPSVSQLAAEDFRFRVCISSTHQVTESPPPVPLSSGDSPYPSPCHLAFSTPPFPWSPPSLFSPLDNSTPPHPIPSFHLSNDRGFHQSEKIIQIDWTALFFGGTPNRSVEMSLDDGVADVRDLTPNDLWLSACDKQVGLHDLKAFPTLQASPPCFPSHMAHFLLRHALTLPKHNQITSLHENQMWKALWPSSPEQEAIGSEKTHEQDLQATPLPYKAAVLTSSYSPDTTYPSSHGMAVLGREGPEGGQPGVLRVQQSPPLSIWPTLPHVATTSSSSPVNLQVVSCSKDVAIGLTALQDRPKIALSFQWCLTSSSEGPSRVLSCLALYAPPCKNSNIKALGILMDLLEVGEEEATAMVQALKPILRNPSVTKAMPHTPTCVSSLLLQPRHLCLIYGKSTLHFLGFIVLSLLPPFSLQKSLRSFSSASSP